MPVLDDLLTLGMSGIHPIEPGPMDLRAVKEKYGQRVCIIGNVSVDRLSSGTPEEIDGIVRECIRAAGPGGGYMVSSSNSIPSYARPENVRAMADAIRKYGQYPLEGI
jgi:uroporphyrinogen decarboxylase